MDAYVRWYAASWRLALESQAPAPLLEQVAQRYAVTVAELLGRSRAPRIALARDYACFVLHYREHRTLEAIGRLLGRCHSTVLRAVRRAKRRWLAQRALISEQQRAERASSSASQPRSNKRGMGRPAVASTKEPHA